MKVKNIVFSGLIFLLSASQVSAGISSGWVDYFVGKLGKPGSAAFEVVVENGLILSRLKNEYAAFSFGEDQLNDDEKLSEPIDVSEFSFIVEFEVCGDAKNFFNNTIYKINYRYHTDNTDQLIDEILDINAFLNSVRGDSQPSILASTKDELVTSYLLGVRSIPNVIFQLTLSKDKQYIEVSVTAKSLCQS
tara:strand:+ start:174 stop:746 length:573 start_codon:yes stop_codon:yes gene_type:complete